VPTGAKHVVRHSVIFLGIGVHAAALVPQSAEGIRFVSKDRGLEDILKLGAASDHLRFVLMKILDSAIQTNELLKNCSKIGEVGRLLWEALGREDQASPNP